ncbi:MAG: F0F1 ATP synthase subunit A [Bacteroidia bacterium]
MIFCKKQIHCFSLFLAVAFSLSVPSLFAQEAKGKQEHHETREKKFNAGEMIMHHIVDAHEWHIADIGDKAITIPLPVILYNSQKGLDVFMSSEFNHGETEYNGYILDHGHIKSADGTEFWDFSITKHAAALIIGSFLVCFIFISVANNYKRNPNRAPKGMQSLIEPLILFVRDEIAKPSIGPKYQKFVPYLLTIFFFIWINNILGLLPIFPGGANVTGSIAVTMILAIFTFIITSVNATKGYWIHIVNTPGVPWWLKFPVPLMPFVEIIGVLSKPFVLMVRLFANITAGHIIVLGFFSLIFIFAEMNEWLGLGVSAFSVLFTIFMYVLELLVAFLQAYVFTLLSAIYFGMAVEEHHHEHDEHHEPVPVEVKEKPAVI